MSVPKPSFTWCLETLYTTGGGRWVGDVTQLQPSQDLFVPSEGVPAQWMNYIHSRETSDIAGLRAFSTPMVAMNWPTTFALSGLTMSSGSFAALFGMFYADPTATTTGGYWMALCSHSGGNTLNAFQSFDHGRSWADFSSSTMITASTLQLVATCASANPATNDWVVGYTASFSPTGTIKIVKGTQSISFGWASVNTTLSDATGWAVFTSNFIAGNFVIAGWGGVLGTFVQYSTDQGATWHAPTFSPTSQFSTGMNTGSLVSVAGAFAGASRLLLFPVHNPVSARLDYAYSTDGTTWTFATLSTALGSTETVVSASWDSANAIFVVATTAHIFTSPDGITWTTLAVSTPMVTGGGSLSCVTCLGGLWLALGGGWQGAYSIDLGASWHSVYPHTSPVSVAYASGRGFLVAQLGASGYFRGSLLGG